MANFLFQMQASGKESNLGLQALVIACGRTWLISGLLVVASMSTLIHFMTERGIGSPLYPLLQHLLQLYGLSFI
jgi:hypothetical protein